MKCRLVAVSRSLLAVALQVVPAKRLIFLFQIFSESRRQPQIRGKDIPWLRKLLAAPADLKVSTQVGIVNRR